MVDAKVRHISFATVDFSDAARLLRASARRHGIETFIYTDDHPVIAQLRRANPVTMSGARGAGHWLWKPAIIRDAMARSADGTIILYTDVAMQFAIAQQVALMPNTPPQVAQALSTLLHGNLDKVMISAFVWLPYLILSERVNVTFRQRVRA